MYSITAAELARLRRDALIADAARARRIRALRARTTPPAWGWRRGRLVPVPRAAEGVDHAQRADVDHAVPHRSKRNTARVARPPDPPDAA